MQPPSCYRSVIVICRLFCRKMNSKAAHRLAGLQRPAAGAPIFLFRGTQTIIRVDRREVLRAAFCFAVLATCASQAFAQAVAVAQINGQVTDATGSGIPGASVRAVES